MHVDNTSAAPVHLRLKRSDNSATVDRIYPPGQTEVNQAELSAIARVPGNRAFFDSGRLVTSGGALQWADWPKPEAASTPLRTPRKTRPRKKPQR